MRTRNKASVVLLAAILATTPARAAADLADGFRNPPDSAKPRTWWHWISGHVSKEGITADLEAIKRIGVGGVQAFSVDQGLRADKPVLYMSPEWREMMRHAVHECARLNLELTMHNCEGWSESGGPWVKPENSMQKVVWTETIAKGPGKVDLDLGKPETNEGFYSDIAVLAFPKLAGDDTSMATLKPTVRTSGSADAAKLTDGDPKTKVTITPEKKGGRAFVEYTFDHPVRCGSVVITPVSPGIKGEVQISEDGKTFHTVGPFSAATKAKPIQAVVFDAADIRAIRLTVPKVAADKPWSIGEIAIGGPRLPDYIARSGMEVKVAPAPFPTNVPADTVIKSDAMVDLTGKMDDSGKLAWDAPAGEWTILRVGATSTGVTVHPAMDDTRGLEVDKLNRKAVQSQFRATVGNVLEDNADVVGKGIHMILLDSWEARCQNWTPLMREEFKGLRGYDPQPWLPALTGRYVGSPELTERFLWDYRRTIADLVAENHFALFQDLAHENNLKLTGEAVGIGMSTIADQLQCKARTDVPMGEFWVDRAPRDGDPKEAASAAHIFGQNVAAAEAFTARPEAAQWRNDPFSIKALGDKMFCLGINRYVFHRYAHQPYNDRVPGVTMGPWGINFERTNTWWEQGRAWIDYVSRCQYLLQRGQFVADLCYYYGEGAPVSLDIDSLKPAPPAGYDFDACDRELLLTQMRVEDGLIVLPSRMRYRVLVLPNTQRMTPEVAAKVKELVSAGATVVGPKPWQSPSLVNFPKCDEDVRRIGEEVWGNCDGKTFSEHAYGKGKVVCGKKIEDVLGVTPDFETHDEDVRYIHRRDGQADMYFIANQRNVGRVIDCTFRVTGKAPELWWPDTGKSEQAAMWEEKDGRTRVRLPLDPVGSVFVVFRDKATGGGLADVKLDGKSILAVEAEKPAGTLAIRKAVYGDLETKKGERDVTAKVAAAVKGGKLVISPDNATFGGDPAPLVPKQFKVEYVYNGAPGVQTVAEGKELHIPALEDAKPLALAADVHGGNKGQVLLTAWKAGTYELAGADGSVRRATVATLPPTIEVGGPWDVRFRPGRLAPESATFEKLVSWTDRPEEGVKYFSGTATYVKDVEVPAEAVAKGHRVRLDLGGVKNLAEVRVNGKDLGVLWKVPFALDVTDALRAGKNRLEVRVTNLWPNRLIGDLNLPEDKRVTWTTYNPYKKNSPLLKSGLIGPVRLEVGQVVEVAGR